MFILSGKQSYCHNYQASQKNKDGNFINAVHYAQIKRSFAAGIGFPEKISGYGRKIK